MLMVDDIYSVRVENAVFLELVFSVNKPVSQLTVSMWH